MSIKSHSAYSLAVAAGSLAMLAMLAPAEAARSKRNKPQSAAFSAVTTPVALPAPQISRPAVLSNPLVVAVSLNAQTATVYSGTEVIAKTPISSGMAGFATPTGVFSIIQKNRYHESNIYDNAPMPFMQRLTWSGVALHAGKLPGYPASHGCVRIPYDTAERLFGMLKMGTRVVVAPEVVMPQVIEHAALPKPVYTPVTVFAAAPALPNLTLASTGGANSSDVTAERLLNPPQWAEHEKRRALASLTEAQTTARRAMDAAAAAVAAAEEAADERRRVEREITSFQSLLERARGQIANARDDESRIQAEASVAAFEDAIVDATAALPAIRKAEGALLDQSFAEARRAREAEDAAERADAAFRSANRGGEPITVFISRADQRVQVRQGFHTIIEGDVTIRDAHLPLGTHVMTAGAKVNETDLRWTTLTLSDGGNRGAPTAALDRISMDPQLAAAIGQRLWTGATMLISDQPASRETGKGTDFVILTK